MRECAMNIIYNRKVTVYLYNEPVFNYRSGSLPVVGDVIEKYTVTAVTHDNKTCTVSVKL